MEGNRDKSATYSQTQNPSGSSSVVKATDQSATGEMEPEFAIQQSCYSSDPLKMKITSRWSSKTGDGQQETGLAGPEKTTQKTGKDAASSNSKSPKRQKQNVTSESASLSSPSSSSSSSSSASAAAAVVTATAVRPASTDTAVSTSKTMGNIPGSEGSGPGGQILVDPDDPVLQETINKSLVDKGGGGGHAGAGAGDNNNAAPEEEGDVSLQELDPGDLAVFFNASNSSETELLNLDNSDLIRDQIVDALVNSQGSTSTEANNGGQTSVTSAESTTTESTSTALSQSENPSVTTGITLSGDGCNNNNSTTGGDKSQVDTGQPKSTPVNSVPKTSTVTTASHKHNHSSQGTNSKLATKRTLTNAKDKANPVVSNLKRVPVTISSKSSDEPAKKKRAMPSQKLQPKLSSQQQLQQKQKLGAKLIRDSPTLSCVKAKPNANSDGVRAPSVKSLSRPDVCGNAMTPSKLNSSCARTDSRSPSTKQKSNSNPNSNPRANSDAYVKPDSTSKLKLGVLSAQSPVSRKMKPDSTSKLKAPSHNTEPKTQSHSKPKQVVNAKPKVDLHSKAKPDSNAKLRPEGKVNLQAETRLNTEKEKPETQNKAAADSSSEVVPDGHQKVIQSSSLSVEADSLSTAQTDSHAKPSASVKVKKTHSQVKPKSSASSKPKADSLEKSSAKKTVNSAIKTKTTTNSNSRIAESQSQKNKEDLNSDSSRLQCSKTSSQAPLQSSKKSVSVKARPDSQSSLTKPQSHATSKEKVHPRTTNKLDPKTKDSGSVSSKKKSLQESTQKSDFVLVKKTKVDSQPKARLDPQSKKIPEKDKQKVDSIGESAGVAKQTCSTVQQLCAQESSSVAAAMAVAQPEPLLRIENESNVSPDSGIHESSFAGSPANHDPASPSRQAQTSSQEPSDPEGPPVLENMKESEPVPCHDDSTLVAPVLTERFEAVKCDTQNKTHTPPASVTCETMDKDKPQQQPQPAPVAPVKRGPGRPRKNPITVVAPGQKRSPGRPKGSGQRKSKNILHKMTSNQKQTGSQSADIPATLKKKPGFKKRKMGTKLVTLPNGIQVLVPVRKGPGRPPKNPLPLDIMKGLKALPPSALTKPIKMSTLDGLLGRTKSQTKSSFVSSSGKPYNIGPPVLQLDSPPKKRGPGRPPKQRPTEKDAELESLLRSIQHSISHQFEQQGESSRVFSTAPNDASSKPSTLATNTASLKDISGQEKSSNTKFVPLIRKPKLHVLMKSQKKKSRKKTGEASVPSNNLNVPLGLNPSFGGLLAMSAVSRGFPGTGSSHLTSSLIKQHMEKNNKFTLPPLAPLSPLSGHGSLPSPQTPKSTESKSDDGLSKRRKKKHPRFKTKHKNIVDPRFLAEVEDLASSISDLYISKPPFLVEEIPPRILLPGIFHLSQEAARLKRRQELHLSKHRKLESKKDLALNSGNAGTASDDASQSQSLVDINAAVSGKDKMKRRRRKKVVIEGETELLSDSGDVVSSEQCLPLKKRHKALAATQLNEKGEEVGEDGTVVVRTPEKRRPGRPRKHAIVETTTATEVSASPVKADVTRNSIDEAIEATVLKYTTDLSRAGGATEDHSKRPKVAFDTSSSRRKSESKPDSKSSAGPEEDKPLKTHRGPGRPRKVSESEKSPKKTFSESIAITKDSAVAKVKVDSSAGTSAAQDANAASCKKSVETATETESESRPKTSHSEMAIQTDSDMQTDIDSTQSQPKPMVKKTVTLDIGVQVDPAEMMAEQEKPTDKVLCSSSVAIQVTEPVPAMQPLEIQVDMDDTDHANVGTSPLRPHQSPRKNSSPRGVGRHSPRSPQRASPRLSPRKPVSADTASEDFPIVSPMKGSEASSPALSGAKPEGAAVEKPRGRSPGRPRSQKSPRKLKLPPSDLNSSGENSEMNIEVPLSAEKSQDADEQDKPKTVCVALPKKMLTPRFEAEFERFLHDAKGPCRGPRTSSPRGAGPPTDSHYSGMDSSNNSERYGSGDAGTDQHEKLDTSSESEKLNKSSEPEVCVIDDSDRDGDNRDVIVIDEEEDEETRCLACLQLQKDASRTPPKKRGPGRPSKVKRGRPPKNSKQSIKSPHTCNKESGAKSDSESVVILDKPAKCNKGLEPTNSSQSRVRVEDSARDPTPSTSRGTSGAVPPPYVNFFSQGDTDSLLDTSNSLLEDSMDITTTTQSGFSSQLSQSSQQSDADPSDVDWTPHLETSPRSKFARSEYEPLPLMSKKRKRYKEDMGYSKPKKRRRKKKKLAESLWDLPSFGMDSIDDDPSLESDLLLDSSVCESSASSSQGSRRGSQQTQLSLPKKRFQKAGLFSTTYKDEDPTRRKSLEHKKSMAYDPAEHEHGLMPPPIHVGKYLREKRVDFQLPFDVYWMQQQGMFAIQKAKSPTYKKIRHNVYFDPNIKPRNCEPHPCNCRRPMELDEKGCGEYCLNRLVFTECNPGTCPSGEQCSNRAMQKGERAEGLEKYQTEDRGYGVRCKKDIKSGNFICEYLGEVIGEQEFRRRMTEEYSNDRHHYCLNLDSGLVIDGYRMGNICRFVNHSCEPNCEMQKWNVNGVYRIGLFALDDVDPMTELTYDYNFRAYNLAAQQECRCGSQSCRGVMGGRASRPNGQVKDRSGSPASASKDRRRKSTKNKRLEETPRQIQAPLRPLSHRERCFAQKHAIFLLRNLEKVKQSRNQSKPGTPRDGEPEFVRDSYLNKADVFLTQFTALKTARSVRTRGLAQAEGNTEVTRAARLAQVFRIIYTDLTTSKDDDGNLLSNPLMMLPSKKKYPEYYKLIKEPIDLTIIDKNIVTGKYKSIESFENDIMKLFCNVEEYCGRKTAMGKIIQRLRKVYSDSKVEVSALFEEIMCGGSSGSVSSECDSVETSEAADKSLEITSLQQQQQMLDPPQQQPEPGSSRPPAEEEEEEEEVISCICNIFRDEGLMIQCERCNIWQHCDCMEVEGDVEHYLCEQCDPRAVRKEILLAPQPDDALPNCTYYQTLMQGNTQVRVGECVYLVQEGRERSQVSPEDALSMAYRNSELDPDKLDIFRVERLFKNNSGKRFAYGHYYLRPHETYHEPSRKFFPNEVFRVPLYENVPLTAVVGECCVMDLAAYCKGRPKGVQEEDVYICEYRVDKKAHLFSKISRPNYPVNCKSYCFDHFDKKLQPKRTYSPHEVPDSYKRRGGGGGRRSLESRSRVQQQPQSSTEATPATCEASFSPDSDEDVPLIQVKQMKIQQKKERLNGILVKLLSSIPGKNPVDMSWMLDGGKRQRKKPITFYD